MISASAEKALRGIPTHWPLASLGTLLTFLTSGSRGWAAYYTTEGDLFLRIQNVGRNKLLLDDIAFVRAPDTTEARRTQVQTGDVLLSITADLGRTAVIPEGMSRAFINQHLALLRLHDDVDPYFVSAFLASPAGQVQIGGLNRQGVKAGLNFDDIRSIYIPLPPLPEQRRIASILDKADAIRRKRQRAIARMEDFLCSVFLEMFGDPVINPKGWNAGTIDDIVTNPKEDIRCGPFGTQLKVHEIVTAGVPLLGIENVHNDRFVPAIKKFLTERKAEELSRFNACPGDVLITRMGTIGRACVVPNSTMAARISYHLFRIRPNSQKCLPEFLAATICRSGTFQNQLNRLAHGAIMDGLSTGMLREVVFLLPPIENQCQYLGIIRKMELLLTKVENAAQSADKLFNSLSYLAFRGELTNAAADKILQQAAAN
jgi:type I restriction enzyme, S subunit